MASVGIKICRLCADTKGPFLNIFGLNMDMAGKINQLLAIVISEWDDLPHKICYRCSAKVAELSEFAEKCKDTQDALSVKYGKKSGSGDRSSGAKKWGKTSTEQGMSNDEYCDRLIKKALDSLPLKDVDESVYSNSDSKNDGSSNIFKDFQVVLTRMNDKDNSSKLANSKLKRNTRNNRKSLSADNWSVVNVTGIGTVYTCKSCKKLLDDESKAHDHVCPKNVLNAPKIEKIDQSILKTEDNSYDEKLLKSIVDLNKSVITPLTATNVDKLNSYMVKMPDNSFVLLRVMDTDVSSKNMFDIAKEKPKRPLKDSFTQVDVLGDSSNGFVNSNSNPSCKLRLKRKRNKAARVDSPVDFGYAVENSVDSDHLSDLPLKEYQPYPVGLFYGVSKNSNSKDVDNLKDDVLHKQSKTSVEKSQSKSYRITSLKKSGKLVISSVSKKLAGKKPEAEKRKIKNSVEDVKDQKVSSSIFQDNKEYFTFVNIDPISDSNFVLPVTNHQEEKLSNDFFSNETLTNKTNVQPNLKKKEKFECYICTMQFPSESTFSSHLSTHFTGFDDFEGNSKSKSKRKKK